MSAAHIPAHALLPGKYRHSIAIPQTNLLSCTRSNPNLTRRFINKELLFFFRARTIFPLKKIVTCKDSSNSCLCLLHVYRYSPVLQSSSNTAQCRRSYALSLSSHYCQSHCLGQLWDFSNSLLRANTALEDKYVRHFSEGSKI